MASIKILASIFCVFAHSCYAAKLRYEDKIVNGVAGDINNFPYQVSIQSNGYHTCGASILNGEWVLTAAHCVDGEYPWSLTLRAGSSIKETGGQVRHITGYIKHENYNNKTFDYDIALMRLNASWAFGPGIQPITMSTSLPPTGTQVTLSGWGALKPGGPSPTQLQTVNVTLVSREECSTKYDLTDRMFCAYAEGKDSCQGDSGGPAVITNDASGNPILIGVVSFGHGCATPGYPGVYEDVAYLRPWIKQYTGF